MQIQEKMNPISKPKKCTKPLKQKPTTKLPKKNQHTNISVKKSLKPKAKSEKASVKRIIAKSQKISPKIKKLTSPSVSFELDQNSVKSIEVDCFHQATTQTEIFWVIKDLKANLEKCLLSLGPKRDYYIGLLIQKKIEVLSAQDI